MSCRGRFPKGELLRVVRSPHGRVEVDPTGKQPGRGAYLCRQEGCWQQLLKKGRLEYTLHHPVSEEDRQRLRLYYQTSLGPAPVGEVR